MGESSGADLATPCARAARLLARVTSVPMTMVVALGENGPSLRGASGVGAAPVLAAGDPLLQGERLVARTADLVPSSELAASLGAASAFSIDVIDGSGARVGVALGFDRAERAWTCDEISSARDLASFAALGLARSEADTNEATVARALAEAEARARRYSALVGMLSEIVWVVDAHGRPLPHLSTWQEYGGLPRTSLDWTALLHPEDLPAIADVWRHSIATRTPHEARARIRRADGEYRTMIGRATPVLDELGDLREWVGAMRDVTEETRARELVERVNRELEERVVDRTEELRRKARLLDLVRSAVIVRSLDGRITYWNRGAELLYGYTSDYATGKIARDLLRSEGEPKMDRLLAEGVWDGEVEQTNEAGARLVVDSRQALLRDDRGEPEEILELNTDITQRRRLEEQLRRKNDLLFAQNLEVQEATRQKSEFLANMSHELRTPLNGVIGFSELLFDGKVGPLAPAHREYVGDILSAGRHLLDLINDLLDLAKIEAGKMQFHPEHVRADELVTSVCDTVRLLAETKRIAISVEVDEAVRELFVDAHRLRQVLLNYLSNALKFTGEHGKVALRLRPEGDDWFRVEVEDTGIGIRAEDQPTLFVEFHQLDAGARKKYPGTGLGLALVRHIVEAQGGSVGVDSHVGKGSTFFATLPRAQRMSTGAPTR